jgi:hypothetical protein
VGTSPASARRGMYSHAPRFGPLSYAMHHNLPGMRANTHDSKARDAHRSRSRCHPGRLNALSILVACLEPRGNLSTQLFPVHSLTSLNASHHIPPHPAPGRHRIAPSTRRSCSAHTPPARRATRLASRTMCISGTRPTTSLTQRQAPAGDLRQTSSPDPSPTSLSSSSSSAGDFALEGVREPLTCPT